MTEPTNEAITAFYDPKNNATTVREFVEKYPKAEPTNRLKDRKRPIGCPDDTLMPACREEPYEPTNPPLTQYFIDKCDAEMNEPSSEQIGGYCEKHGVFNGIGCLLCAKPIVSNEQKARYIVERTGGCWHELSHYCNGNVHIQCLPCLKCGKIFKLTDFYMNHGNPTFLDPAGRIQLLELMMGRGDWWIFISNIGDLHRWDEEIGGYDKADMIPVDLMTDNTGLLLNAVWRFLKEKTND
jgi:hypothetical protein